MHGMENAKSVFKNYRKKLKKKKHDFKVVLVLDNAPLWGFHLYHQGLLAWCLVEASPRFSVRNPISSISPVTFITQVSITLSLTRT